MFWKKGSKILEGFKKGLKPFNLVFEQSAYYLISTIDTL